MTSTRGPFAADLLWPITNFLSVSINNNVVFSKQKVLYPVQGNLIVDLSLLNKKVLLTDPQKISYGGIRDHSQFEFGLCT